MTTTLCTLSNDSLDANAAGWRDSSAVHFATRRPRDAAHAYASVRLLTEACGGLPGAYRMQTLTGCPAIDGPREEDRLIRAHYRLWEVVEAGHAFRGEPLPAEFLTRARAHLGA